MDFLLQIIAEVSDTTTLLNLAGDLSRGSAPRGQRPRSPCPPTLASC
jgi:hypothetical protein